MTQIQEKIFIGQHNKSYQGYRKVTNEDITKKEIADLLISAYNRKELKYYSADKRCAIHKGIITEDKFIKMFSNGTNFVKQGFCGYLTFVANPKSPKNGSDGRGVFIRDFEGIIGFEPDFETKVDMGPDSQWASLFVKDLDDVERKTPSPTNVQSNNLSSYFMSYFLK